MEKSDEDFSKSLQIIKDMMTEGDDIDIAANTGALILVAAQLKRIADCLERQEDM